VFSRCSLASLALPVATVHALIHLDLLSEHHGVNRCHGAIIKCLQKGGIGSLSGLQGNRKIPPTPVRGNTSDEQI
jgi:hypothetical protein